MKNKCISVLLSACGVMLVLASVASCKTQEEKRAAKERKELIERENKDYGQLHEIASKWVVNGEVASKSGDEYFFDGSSEDYVRKYMSSFGPKSDAYDKEHFEFAKGFGDQVEMLRQKMESDRKLILESFGLMKDAYAGKRFGDVLKRYDAFRKAYNEFEGVYGSSRVKEYFGPADELARRANNPWPETDKYKNIVRSIGDVWKNQHVFIGNTDTGMTIEDILRYHDFRDQTISALDRRIYLELNIEYGHRFGYSIGVTFRMERISGRPTITAVVFDGDISKRESDIRSLFDESFITRRILEGYSGIYD